MPEILTPLLAETVALYAGDAALGVSATYPAYGATPVPVTMIFEAVFEPVFE